ncbi:cytochrome P450 [Ganoderma sinense ZZ0214-1]|uniref:Cytochrome P450 n=1 Tax=Ganoderma sinense ZZ0214-1 TaxID=1077348 RepID=A0A2G8SLB0_9APHY|nr:cytochrome P450 [Ganoderma sinense ZZ0214-1]
MGATLLLGAAGAVVIPYTLWWIFGDYLLRSPLDNLPGPAPSFLTLDVGEAAVRQAWKFWAKHAKTYGPVSLIYGLLGRRVLVIHDPKALHTVMVKDQEFYTNSVAPSNDFSVLLGPGLLSTTGMQHKRQRKLLNPVFSVAHLRDMVQIFYNVAHKAQKAISTRVPADGTAEVLDVNGWMARITLEMLGQAGLGYSFDNFVEDSTDPYGESLRMFFPAQSRFLLFGALVMMLSYVMSDAALRRFFSIIPLKGLQDIMDISVTMRRRSQEIIEEKKAALRMGDDVMLQEVGEGKDLMSICLKANMAASEGERLSDEELIAQMSTFTLAGMDTTSNALSRILHVLAQHPDAQEKLRAELVEAQGGPDGDADMSYDALDKLPYLDAVCRETLRVFAPVSLSGRVATRDSVIPFANPVRGRDGKDMHEVVVPKGMVVITHYQASNSDPALWGEDAEEWKPERWLAPLPSAVEDARIPGVYSNLMTFAAGSRSCILLTLTCSFLVEVVLAVLLPKFSFEVTDQEITWNSSAVIYPTMGEGSSKPEMLLKVKAL